MLVLQNKVAYYEREHEDFQNKLLAQRQSYESDIAKLKSELAHKDQLLSEQ